MHDTRRNVIVDRLPKPLLLWCCTPKRRRVLTTRWRKPYRSVLRTN